MRNPIHVLKSLEEKASVSNNKYERLYRNLYNPEFYLLAYANIAKSQGSMTQGVDGQTLDNMSLPRINRIIESIRNRTYQPKPAKRKYIPKKNGKLRPLGITSTDDKLVQEVVRMILEAIYEPTFSNNSHGFRPKRSCHTALTQVKKNFTGVTWIVEGDIKACFTAEKDFRRGFYRSNLEVPESRIYGTMAVQLHLLRCSAGQRYQSDMCKHLPQRTGQLYAGIQRKV